MASQFSQPLVLEYKTRRYDGGTEREMIEQIENQLYHQQQLQGAYQAGPYPAQPGPVMPYAPIPHPASGPSQRRTRSNSAKSNWGHKVYKAFSQPIMELILGISGVIVGSVMMTPFMKEAHEHPALKHERQQLVRHSWLVVGYSILGILTSPFRAMKLCLQ